LILVTGAKGYIGSELSKKLDVKYQWDIREWDIRKSLNHVMEEVTCVVHLAALVRVGESVARPLDYYETNVQGTVNVLKAFPNAKIVFASTGAAFNADSPYGHSKVMAEQIIKDSGHPYTIFRFYNVGGGEPTNPDGLPMAIERAKETGTFTIHGSDYDTKDGTCVRDFVHVEDICDAIIRAVEQPAAMTDFEPLGSGQSFTVKEFLETHQSKYGELFDITYGDRREGDLPRSEVPFMSNFMKPTKTLRDIV